jgi:mannose-6-phosphate isomerase-like protein (cupin superfamily)
MIYRIFIPVAAFAGLSLLSGQDGRGVTTVVNPPATWWVEKTKGGVYVPPNKPLTKLSDLKARHAGQTNWTELIMKDPEHQAEYNSAAPGTKFRRRMHPDTGNFMVVIAGEMHFDIEGQAPVVATRGSIVNIMKTTPFSYEIGGNQPALWVDVNPVNFKTMYPGNDPKPPVTIPGAEVVKVAFANGSAPYTAPNMPHWNLFEAAKAGSPAGVRVLEDHLFANPLYGFADPNDPLNPNRGTAGAGARGGRGADAAPFNPNSTFGHMHAGPAEWWIVQVGQITARFENIGELVASEGDVLYAAPMTWHQMGFKGPGPSCRLAMGAYPLINMNSMAGQ